MLLNVMQLNAMQLNVNCGEYGTFIIFVTPWVLLRSLDWVTLKLMSCSANMSESFLDLWIDAPSIKTVTSVIFWHYFVFDKLVKFFFVKWTFYQFVCNNFFIGYCLTHTVFFGSVRCTLNRASCANQRPSVCFWCS